MYPIALIVIAGLATLGAWLLFIEPKENTI